MSMQPFNPSTGELAQQGGGLNLGPTDTVISLAEWAQELDAAYTLAQSICQTPFVPQHFRGKPEDGAVAILYGKSLNMAPIIALRSIYSVHGTPALYAQQMYAIALSHGHHIVRVHATETSVKFRARRKGDKEWQDVEWTIERAEKAKYTTNPKYRENPIGMLTEKCKAEAAKLVAADALAGMASVEEIELGDYDVVEVTEVPAPAPAPKRTVKRKPAAQAPAPELPPVVEDAPAVAVDQDDEPAPQEPEAQTPSTRSQWLRLGNALDTVGVTDKADKTESIRSWATAQGITRDVASAKDLTGEEITTLIAELESDPDAQGDATPAEDWDTQEVPS